ncbi:ABC transporter ATP-binding protein [Vibrio penaeicida]|uniref:ABC transporter ATP-binding protein n=1 Tax=Vibrio penaeicida TaxID=104609 RepID=UPI000CEA356E|nr:ABC transporter ATP-binding protein [Vibrio penaeicida]
MSTQSTLILDVEKLCAKSSLGWKVLTQATFTVSQGECVAIIGPNGCGKSSLLKAISGEYEPLEGRLFVEGVPVSEMSPQQKAKSIAVVAQNDHVDPRLTVREYVWLGRVPHTFCCSKSTHERAVENAIQDVNLSDKADRPMGALSGGEQQRANIARAFAQEPKLMLLDEPTNHLDPLARLELLELIKNRNMASIAVLHDLPLVAPFADKVILMSEQKIVKCDTAEEILQDKHITPVFGLRVLTFNHPHLTNVVHHFEAAGSRVQSSLGVA